MARKFTISEAKKIFEDQNCILLEEEYFGSETPMNYICECGNKSKITLKCVRIGQRCNLCRYNKVSSALKFSYEYVSEFFKENNCMLLSSEYNGVKDKLTYICSSGHKTTTTFDNFKNGHRCKLCANKKHSIRATHSFEHIKNYIEVESHSGYKLISKEYKGISEKIEVMCDNGHFYEVTFTGFKDKGVRCRECQGLKNTLENIQSFVLNNSNHTLISQEYNGAITKLEFECELGHRYEMRFNDFKRGSRCAECVGLKRLTLEEVKKRILIINTDIEISSMNRSKGTVFVGCKCKVCGGSWKGIWTNISNRTAGCPFCSESKGERRIRQFLVENHISFLKEYTFDECKNKQKLFFDFAIFYKDNLVYLIEYDGIQHFEASDFFGGEDRLNYCQKNDKIKNKYCDKNSIKLVRIPYWDFDNIEKILKNEILHNLNIELVI